MKIVQINTVPNGSTGTIMMNIHNELLNQGHESYVVWGRGRKAENKNEIYMNDKLGVYFHVLYSRITGKVGFASKKSTRKLLKKLDEIKPDIIHIHNIHGYYINIELLFNYIKKNNIKVVWTLHDCWAFTGHCVHFENEHCDKWKSGCKKCTQLKKYPKSFIDQSKWCYNMKKKIFTSIDDCTIVTPSKWLANLVSESFLCKFNIKVINNGIDTNIFKIIDKGKLQFRNKYNLEGKKIVLGVASVWTKEKGYEDFIELSKKLEDTWRIVLVGINKKQLKKLPNRIIGIQRTSSKEELVDIYNSANVFFNPTYEDNYPTCNLEAVACGLNVITYDTGGSKESAFIPINSRNNIQIEERKNLLENFENIINEMEKSVVSYSIDKENMIKKYIEIYIY